MKGALVLLLLLAAPAAWAGHPVDHDPLGPLFPETCASVLFPDSPPLPATPVRPFCDAANYTAEVATDGYVVLVQRLSASTFNVRVVHGAEPAEGARLPLGTGAAPLADPAVLGTGGGACLAADPLGSCDNNGLWVHGGPDPLRGRYVNQTIVADGGAWNITLGVAPGSVGTVSLLAVVRLAEPEGEWVRGFYHPLKLAVPLDPLDAVPYPVSV